MSTKNSNQANADYLRNFIFGSEDSLVSTVGMLSGVAVANVESSTIVLAGSILILVSAFSMAAGSILSDNSAREYLTGRDIPLYRSALSGTIMFFSYVLVGAIPLLPYGWLPPLTALPISISLSLAALLTIGLISAKLTGTNHWRGAVEMGLVGGAAIFLGAIVGWLLSDIPGL